MSRKLVAAILLSLLCLGLARAEGQTPQGTESSGASAEDWRDRAAAALQAAPRWLPEEPMTSERDRSRLLEADRELAAIIAGAPATDLDLARLHGARGRVRAALGDDAGAMLELRRSWAAQATIETAEQMRAVRSRLRGETSKAGSTASVLDDALVIVARADRGVRWWLGAALIAAACGSMATVLITGFSLRRSMTGIAAALLIVGAISIGSVWLESTLTNARGVAIVTGVECQPRTGPDSLLYEPASLRGQSVLPRGAELMVLESAPLTENAEAAGWLRVRFAGEDDGASVWIPARDAEMVEPPASAERIWSHQ